VSNPFSTGGGGTKFEYEVGALFLASLLTEDIPPGISDGRIHKIQFQASHTGVLLDDVVITVRNGIQRVIAYQIKHKLKFSKSDNTFKGVIRDCWKTFEHSNPEADKVGMGVEIYSQTLDEQLQTLLDWAETSLDSQEFTKKVNLDHFSSDKKREFIETFSSCATSAKGSAITDNELWRFLRSLIIYRFDIRENGGDRRFCINNLCKIVEGQDIDKAKVLFNTLYTIAGRYAVNGGSIDRASLLSLAEVRSQIVDTKPHKIEFNSRAQIILNENVFKPLGTVEVKNDSSYSTTLKVSDGRLANKLPYIRHAEGFLASHDSNIRSQWQHINQLLETGT
jgi:hypothetical protein